MSTCPNKRSIVLTLLLGTLAACGDSGVENTAAYPEMGGERFKVYAANCSACHAPPQPGIHTAEEWPAVIARMQQHRIRRGLGEIPEQQIARIRAYLMAYGKTGEAKIP